jgi:phage shock protein C
MEQKKLHRSRTNKVLAGVCGGVGEYLNMDPTIVRLVWVIIVLLTGVFPGVIVYLLAMIIIPEEPVAPTPPPSV